MRPACGGLLPPPLPPQPPSGPGCGLATTAYTKHPPVFTAFGCKSPVGGLAASTPGFRGARLGGECGWREMWELVTSERRYTKGFGDKVITSPLRWNQKNRLPQWTL